MLSGLRFNFVLKILWGFMKKLALFFINLTDGLIEFFFWFLKFSVILSGSIAVVIGTFKFISSPLTLVVMTALSSRYEKNKEELFNW